MKEKIYNILKSILSIDENVLLDGDQSLEEFGLDSMLFIEMVVELEISFDVEIPDEYLLIQSLDTINKIFAIITELPSLSSMGDCVNEQVLEGNINNND